MAQWRSPVTSSAFEVAVEARRAAMTSLDVYLAGSLLLLLAKASPFDRDLDVNNECGLDWGAGQAFEHRLNQTRWCLEEGRVLHDKDWQCYDLHSQGPCQEGERIVFMMGTVCPTTTCRRHTDLLGELCTDGKVSHQGQCVDPIDKDFCGVVPGRRLEADPWGNYSCKCSSVLGFVELEGKCWPRFLQGPCQEGDQVTRGDNGEVVCREDSCRPQQGNFLQTDFYLGPGDLCYDLVTIFSKLESENSSLTQEEQDLFRNDPKVVNSPHHGEFVDTRKTQCSGTFCTCKKSFDVTGECEEFVEIDDNRLDVTFNLQEILGQSWNNSSVVGEIINAFENTYSKKR